MWAQLVNTALGVWMMAAPAVLGSTGGAATNARIIGPLIGSFAFVAAPQINRGVRWVNVPLGIWLAIAPFVLNGYSAASTVNSVIVGLVVAALAPIGHTDQATFGGGWKTLFATDDLPS